MKYLSVTEIVWWSSECFTELSLSKGRNSVIKKSFPFSNGFDGTFESLIKDCYKGIKGEKSFYPTGIDAFQNVKLCGDIYKSAMNNGEWIEC